MKKSFIRTAPILFGIAAIVACGSDDSTAPDATVAGTYQATVFTSTGSSGITNHILAGSTLILNLAPDGTLSGHLHMVATSSNSALDADMAGTWVQSGNTVNFTQTADTFVRNITFAISANGNLWELEGNRAFSGTDIHIKLTQVVGIL
jgi:hypothetical protein